LKFGSNNNFDRITVVAVIIEYYMSSADGNAKQDNFLKEKKNKPIKIFAIDIS